jgi:hypothetical protein
MRRRLAGEGIPIPALAYFGHVVGCKPGPPRFAHQPAHGKPVRITLEGEDAVSERFRRREGETAGARLGNDVYRRSRVPACHDRNTRYQSLDGRASGAFPSGGEEQDVGALQIRSRFSS